MALLTGEGTLRKPERGGEKGWVRGKTSAGGETEISEVGTN